MPRSAGPRVLPALALLLLVLTYGCGGGGGGGGSSDGTSSSGSGTQSDFYMKSASVARAILGIDGQLDQVVNPASLYEVDPLTGVPLAGFPKPLNPGGSLTNLSTINLGQVQDPLTPQIPLVPRNSAIVIDFTKAIDAATLGLTSADNEAQPNMIQASSPVQVLRKDGQLVPVRAWVDGKRLVLLGVTPATLGFEASPLVFDSQGKIVEDAKGYMRIVLGVIGKLPLKATDGTVLGTRPDGLGGPGEPFPFNPGNSGLDAIVQQTDTGIVTFNGFLPDKSPPRLVRAVTREGSISGITTVSVGGQLAIRIEAADLLPAPNVVANAGLGEWANSRMIVTSAGGAQSQYVVERNLSVGGVPTFELEPGSLLDPAVAIDDTFELTRSEFFEPVPPPLPSDPAELARLTVDPENVPRDPLDPEDLHNSDLRYFVRVFDEGGVERTTRWNPATGTFLPVPPKSMLQVTFNEPMDVASFKPYETFYVKPGSSGATDAAYSDMRVGDVQASDQGRTIRFRPYLTDQTDPGASEFIGFGGTASALRLVLRTIPEGSDVSALQSSASPAVLAQLQDLPTLGISGVTDLGGRGLGLPAALLDQGDTENFILASTSAGVSPFPPAVDFSVEFQTQSTSDPDYGVLVHRFQGQAKTATFTYPEGSVHDEVTAGVEFNDFPPVVENGEVVRRFIYGPTLTEVGLNVPGRLTGAPANTIEHVIDNFNPPKPSNFASPNGEDFLISVGFGLGVPINSPFGARFQHIYRAGDASPAVADYQDVVLDLVGLAWSPTLPLNNTSLDSFEVVVGLGSANNGKGPNTNQTNGIPDATDSGLVRQFDCNTLDWHDNCFSCSPSDAIAPALQKYVANQPPMTSVVKKGTPYPISNANLFKPSSAGSSLTNFNFYLDYPKFNAGFDPYFGSNSVFSFPYDSRFPMLIEYRIGPNNAVPLRNSYRFSPGILTSVLPRFRVWSQGQDPLAHCVPNTVNVDLADNGTFKNVVGGEGGPLLEPGCFTQTIQPPEPNNGMPPLVPSEYVLPPRDEACESLQPKPDSENGEVDKDIFCLIKFPKCNTDPSADWYFADGMLAYPLPNKFAYPGPTGQPPTYYVGYGPPVIFSSPAPVFDGNPCLIPNGTGQSNLINIVSNEPGYTGPPANFGDNSRYYMLWKYKKRVSLVQSPTIEVDTPSGEVRYLRPIIDPPLSTTSSGANLKVEVKAGTLLDFSVPQLDSGYVDVLSPSFEDDVTGVGGDRIYVKFRASFAVAAGSTQPPTIDTIIIPYVKVKP
ncbi:MAG: hypothetical protein H6825_04475 [Planctomycetes bacterium]|nr:hypothetical protein [Planctomycetota bacterium]